MRCANCGNDLAPGDKFCTVCGTARRQHAPRFAQAEQQFAALKARHDAGQLGDAAYDAELRKLVLQDESGYWMIGADSGEWYWYDGRQWQRREPPAGDRIPPVPSQAVATTPGTATSRPALAAAVLFVLAVIVGAFVWQQMKPGASSPRQPTVPVNPPATPTATSRPATPAPPVFVPISEPTATRTTAAQARTVTPSAVTSGRTPTATATRVARIAFVTSRDGNANIYLMKPDGSDQELWTEQAGEDWHPSWAPDGVRIAYQRTVKGEGVFNLTISNVDGSISQLTSWDKLAAGGGSGVQRPVWSPDGKRIAFSFDGGTEQNDLMLIGADGSGLKRVTAGRDPTWSPDGQRLAFSARASPTSFEIFSIKPDGTGLTQLTTTGGLLTYPTWSPNGKFIAFVQASGGSSTIGVLEVGAGKTRELVKKPSQGLSWSPDSALLLYGPAGEGLWTVNVDGTSQPRQISKDGVMPAWSP